MEVSKHDLQENRSKVFSEHDVEDAIIAMRTETFRGIQNDREFPEGQLAWYWSYLGALDMAQKLGLISDDRHQDLYHEAGRFKPDCMITAREFEPQDETTTEMKIGGIT